MSNRPTINDYSTFSETYISKVPEGSIKDLLLEAYDTTSGLLASIPEERGSYKYAEGKWSIKEVIGHINDTERVMSYRLLRISRGDSTPLPGFEQDLFIAGARFNEYTIAELADEYRAIRQSTLKLISKLSDEELARRGNASSSEVTALALAYIIAGHELHHLNVLKERYLID
ncbi:DinB superfamily protein [Paenibacillus algorifonticola]|uniref:DinB superfamily protein n=1 Tax=Paenibacillus algorifonticola TaxID=684063 RepID=A0A1I2FN87_9BACL|nr:DinB family protein [Paenibacillus algorifonticola]SFF05891.1 DinB superfamily protein [Paenibacillus algorifonticola]